MVTQSINALCPIDVHTGKLMFVSPAQDRNASGSIVVHAGISTDTNPTRAQDIANAVRVAASEHIYNVMDIEIGRAHV